MVTKSARELTANALRFILFITAPVDKDMTDIKLSLQAGKKEKLKDVR